MKDNTQNPDVGEESMSNHEPSLEPELVLVDAEPRNEPPIDMQPAPEPVPTAIASVPGEQTPKKTLVGHTFDFAIELTKILCIVLLIRAYVVQASSVEGHSMEGTLWENDMLLVERLSMSLVNGPEWLKSVVPDSIMPELERDDIVVLASPENSNNELVKRVIALGGDYIFFYDGRIWVNGEALGETYLAQNIVNSLGKHSSGDYNHYSRSDIDGMPGDFRLDRDEFESATEHDKLAETGVRVPDECVFVMGDNRKPKQSNDSRAWAAIRIGNGPEIDERGGRSDYLWVTLKSIHGRVIARLRAPWQYDDEHPVFPK